MNTELKNKTVKCQCGCECLHQYKVEVFERKEDDDTGLHISVKDQKVFIDNNINNNPSGRRQGVKIYFRCEWCTKKTVLSLAQHKGATYISWE